MHNRSRLYRCVHIHVLVTHCLVTHYGQTVGFCSNAHAGPTTDTSAAPGASELTTKELRQLLTKANKGDKQAFATVCRVPGTAWFWEESGNVAYQAQESMLIGFMGADALVVHEAQRRKCAALRRDLAGTAPTPMETLLVDRVVLCWLHLHCVEALYAQHMSTFSLMQHAFYLRRLAMAQRRYLAAITALAQVRRLQVPAVQVNIAREQLNVAAIAPAHVDQARVSRTAR